LKLFDAVDEGSFPQPFLQCLVIALDLALGLRMVRLAVFEGDAEGCQIDFETCRSSSVVGGVDGTVEFLTDVKPR
jgi:hypothetical protein